MKKRKPPKKIRHAELWWNITTEMPVIMYPNGHWDFFSPFGAWCRAAPNPWFNLSPRSAEQSHYREFITELK